MAELMQQMEENSPRVAALEYCLKLVGDKMKEAEKRSAELEAICAALAAEVQAVKSAALEEIEVINRGGQAYCVKDGMSVNPIYARGWNDYRQITVSGNPPPTLSWLKCGPVLLNMLHQSAGVADTYSTSSMTSPPSFAKEYSHEKP